MDRYKHVTDALDSISVLIEKIDTLYPEEQGSREPRDATGAGDRKEAEPAGPSALSDTVGSLETILDDVKNSLRHLSSSQSSEEPLQVGDEQPHGTVDTFDTRTLATPSLQPTELQNLVNRRNELIAVGPSGSQLRH